MAGPLLGTAPLQRLLKAAIRPRAARPVRGAAGDGAQPLWGEARDAGARVVSRLQRARELRAHRADRAGRGREGARGAARPGFQTPSRAFGKDFILEIEGVTRTDD